MNGDSQLADLKQDLEDCLLKEDDKESVASETHTMPEAQALEDDGLIENKREVLSEGGQSATDHHDDEQDQGSARDELNQRDQDASQCTCGNQKKQSTKAVDVIRILGEGSQGVVALCRYKDEEKIDDREGDSNGDKTKKKFAISQQM